MVSTNGQLAESQGRSTRPRPSSTSAAPAPTRCKPPAGGAEERCRWWCWSTKARPRPARSSPARCRTTSAPPSWAARPSARARCRRCARCRPDTGAEDHHRALLHAQRQVDPGQGHRARRDGSTRPPKATSSPRCARARPTSTSTWAAARAPKSRTPAREKAREEARKKARGRGQEARRADRKPLPEFGTDKDFQLVQALNQLKGQPVLVSKTAVVERKAESRTTN